MQTTIAANAAQKQDHFANAQALNIISASHQTIVTTANHRFFDELSIQPNIIEEHLT